MDYLRKTVLVALAKGMSAAMTPELFKEFAEKIVDFIETKVLGTASTVDDSLILPLVDAVRSAFGLNKP